jgi:cytoskeleton protein RodZ
MAGEGGLAAFGEELRREREQRGLAVEAIREATKVPVKHILALEAGAFAELPGGVFRRGLVRSYLGALGLEEASWMKRFEDICRESGLTEPTETGWVRFAENVKNSRGTTRRRMRWRWVGRLALLAMLGLAGWCGWCLAAHRSMLPPPQVWGRIKSLVDNAPW